MLAERFLRSTGTEATELLDGAGIANARVNDVADFLAHPVLSGRDRWRDVRLPGGATFSALLPPVDLAGVVPRMDAVPGPGEHTDAILSELGYDPAEVTALRADGVV